MKTTAYGSLFMLFPSWTWAAEELPAIGPIVLQLLLVLGLIAGCTWLVRRTPLARRTGKALAVKESLPLGARDRLIVVRFEDRELLLGVNSQSISLLSDRAANPESRDEPAAEPQGRSFLEFLGQRS